jgi:glycosyltransferase involved in cell wall biosynthesis
LDETFGIVMPAYRAEPTIAASVRSVVEQTWDRWQLLIVSDDGQDYEAVLAGAGLSDSRFRFFTTPTRQSGASTARNVALDAMDTAWGAFLDADDRFKPNKLVRSAQALKTHGIVTTAIDVMDTAFNHLRYVGSGDDCELTAGQHKFVSLSMDSMIVWDRTRTDARCDPTIPNMNDLEFLLQLYSRAPRSFHLGEPLHDYVKVPTSLSNAPTVTERMVASKTVIMTRLREGYYGLDEEAVDGLCRFLTISIGAERSFREAASMTPGLLFEDHLEPRLRVTSSA